MVSGCYDLLHSWHIAFLEKAATFGDLFVYIGSDATIRGLKNVVAYQSEDERLYVIRGLRCVHHAAVSRGSGMLDFEQEFLSLKPDFFCVNKDGDRPEKRELCARTGTQYVVFDDHPGRALGFPWRSSTLARGANLMPYRIDLAGGWLDQPIVSSLAAGPVVVVSIEPTEAFNERSGMATSTRAKAIRLWGNRLPSDDPEHLARTLFAVDNPPGTGDVSGSQDAIGIAMPGLTKANYAGGYWPETMQAMLDEDTLRFVEKSLYLVPLTPRDSAYSPTRHPNLSVEKAAALRDAAEACWSALRAKDLSLFGQSLTASFEAQVALFPDMMTDEVRAAVDAHRTKAAGWKLSGAGGGGYLVLAADSPVEGAHTIRVRRPLQL